VADRDLGFATGFFFGKATVMAQALASDIARRSLGALLERVEGQQRFSPDEARELMAGCEVTAGVQEVLGHLVQGFLARGMEGRKLAFLLKEFVDILEIARKAYAVARERVEAAELPPEECAAAVALLGRAGQRAATMGGEWSGLVRRLETPPRPIDPGTLPADRGEQQAKGYRSLDELAAGLLSHKDV
jgi:hypothetical protein